MFRSYKRALLLCSIVFMVFNLKGQSPANDNCGNADEIVISNSGFGFGVFYSDTQNVAKATRQTGEICSKDLTDGGLCNKTLWYKFYIPTTRDISIRVNQEDSAIPQSFVGFNVYKVNDCNYTLNDLTDKFTVLSKFGLSGNTCLMKGWYYVQVGCNDNAKGKIWLELEAQAPAALVYDNHDQPLDLGIVSQYNNGVFLNVDCASITMDEYGTLKNKNLTRSVFATFTLPGSVQMSEIGITSNTGIVRYRVFYDTLTIDSLKKQKMVDSVKLINQNMKTIIREGCTNFAKNRKYYIQFLTEDNSESSFYIYINVSSYLKDNWNYTNTNDKIKTYNGFKRSIKHYFNCNGLLSSQSCKSVLKDYYPVLIGNAPNFSLYDTFKYAGYTVLDVAQSGVIQVSSPKSDYSDNLNYYILLKGDISAGCSVYEIKKAYTDKFLACVEPGKYTLVTLTSNLGAKEIYHNISQFAPTSNIEHFYPKSPYDLGVFPYNLNTPKEISFNQSRDTVLVVGSDTLRGYMIFQEFKMNITGTINIGEFGTNVRSANYLFKGHLKNGSISKISWMRYMSKFNSYPSNGCMVLDSGLYTIVSVLDKNYEMLDCWPYNIKTVLAKEFYCTADTFNHPESAFKVNDNKDVLSSLSNQYGINYVYKLNYCHHCGSASYQPALPQYKKPNYSAGKTVFFYFTFYLAQNAEFRSNCYDQTFELFKGDCAANPALLKDTMNIVSLCSSGNLYCNLEGGKYYTFVLFNTHDSTAVLFFTPHMKSINDFAIKTYDLGHFDKSETRSSTPIPVTCHTTGFNSDPANYEEGYNEFIYNFDEKNVIRYKDSLNLKRGLTRKNIWYSFTVSGNSRITIKISGKTPLVINKTFCVYRYLGEYNQSLPYTLSHNFDSTDNSMLWLNTNPKTYYGGVINREDSVVIFNSACSNNRYFILMEEDNIYSDPYRCECIFTVTTQQLYTISDGDECRNAHDRIVSSFGKSLISGGDSCHTYGGTPIESDTSNKYKTTWFKISPSNKLGKFDIKIKLKEGMGVVKFCLYGGNCENLKKIMTSKDGSNYFVLSCVNGGYQSYYLQVFSNYGIDELLVFEIEVLKPYNAKCSPYVYTPPVFDFDFLSNCSNDTAVFHIISSNKHLGGMQWYKDDTMFSLERAPSFKYNGMNKKFTVKLVAYDTVTWISDTIVHQVELDTTKYFVKIQPVDSIHCMDSVRLISQTNLLGTMKYAWSSKDDPKVYNSSDITVSDVIRDRKYRLEVSNGKCVYSDSVSLIYSDILDYIKDTSICLNSGELMFTKPDVKNLSIDGKVMSDDTFRFNRSGKYNLAYMLNNCPVKDMVNVMDDTAIEVVNLSDSVYGCNNQKIVLKNPDPKSKDIVWSNSSTSDSLLVYSSGSYTMKSNIGYCKNLNYKVKVSMDFFNGDFIKDTMICQGQSFKYTIPYSGFIINDYIPAVTSNYLENFKTYVKIQKGNCVLFDSSTIKVINTENKLIDSALCKENNEFQIKLDAGLANSYLWKPEISTSRYAQVSMFGQYRVFKYKILNCVDTLDFNIQKLCPVTVYIPTVFTPNEDKLNDVFCPIIQGDVESGTFLIFNRWGEILYTGNQFAGWDGKYQDILVEEGVYSYLLILKTVHNGDLSYRGTFTIIY